MFQQSSATDNNVNSDTINMCLFWELLCGILRSLLKPLYDSVSNAQAYQACSRGDIWGLIVCLEAIALPRKVE